MLGTIKKIILIVSVLCLSSCNIDNWDGFLYPNKNDLTEHINVGKFDTLAQCRSAVARYVQENSIRANQFDYECGKNCRGSSTGLSICEETLR